MDYRVSATTMVSDSHSIKWLLKVEN
jgi:hypothetical protein